MRRRWVTLLVAGFVLGGALPAFAHDNDHDDDDEGDGDSLLEEVVDVVEELGELLFGEDEAILETPVIEDLLDEVVDIVDVGGADGILGEVELIVCGLRVALFPATGPC